MSQSGDSPSSGDGASASSASSSAAPGPPASTAWLASPAKPGQLDLTVDRGDGFRVWKRRWQSFFRLSDLISVSAQSQYGVLLVRQHTESCGRLPEG